MANEPVYNKRGMGKSYVARMSPSYNRLIKSVSKHVRRVGKKVRPSDIRDETN